MLFFPGWQLDLIPLEDAESYIGKNHYLESKDTTDCEDFTLIFNYKDCDTDDDFHQLVRD